MILPIRDILASEKSKASRFGHHGLTIIIKGHEELFFEFGAEDKRDAFVQLLDRQIEDVRKRLASGDSVSPSSGAREALILEEFEAQTPGNESDPSPPTDSMADSLPAVMFTSASSTFLTFKPKKPLHFTFLTIGSRGDVQPYIALAQGLMADGHSCRIATHGEFKEWVESVRDMSSFFAQLLIFSSMVLNSDMSEAILLNSCGYVLRMAHSLSPS